MGSADVLPHHPHKQMKFFFFATSLSRACLHHLIHTGSQRRWSQCGSSSSWLTRESTRRVHAHWRESFRACNIDCHHALKSSSRRIDKMHQIEWGGCWSKRDCAASSDVPPGAAEVRCSFRSGGSNGRSNGLFFQASFAGALALFLQLRGRVGGGRQEVVA